jgi:phosphomethylpyrimidine synthase
MNNKKKIHIAYPSSEKVYIQGDINKVKVGMRKLKLTDTRVVDDEGKEVWKKNNPVIIYDTSGPYSDPEIILDPATGIPRIREEWCARRKDIVQSGNLSHPLYRAKEGKNITQMYYAKRRIITPEMEYAAIRENQQIEDLGLRSCITPDFVRKEIAAGRAVIPANINHPEVEPMIIGKKFLVKVSSPIDYSQASSPIEQEIEKVAMNCFWGSDTCIDISAGKHIHEKRERIIRNCPVPLGTIPVYQALEKVNGEEEALSWPVFRDTLIEQAEQGVDYFIIHAAILREHTDALSSRLSGIVSKGGAIMDTWMRKHKEENFLHTHFAEICEILKAFDVTVLIGSALYPGSIYDANDSLQLAEMHVMSKLTRIALDLFVQVMAENAGHIPMSKIYESIKEQQYHCHGVPLCGFGPVATDIAPGSELVASSIGAALSAWHGTSMIGGTTPGHEAIIANKTAAHAADLAKGHPGAQVRDNAISKARYESRQKDLDNLSI